MGTKVQPITNKYWTEDVSPLELLSAAKALNIGGLGLLDREESLGSKLNCKLTSSRNRFFPTGGSLHVGGTYIAHSF
jgi:hypothetical protein